MPKSVNKAILLGNVGKDPEVKLLPSGLPVATSPGHFGSVQGQGRREPGPHRVAQPDRVSTGGGNYSRLREEGQQVYVEGRIQTRSWDDQASGQKKYRTEIIVNDIVLLSGRGEGESGGGPRSNTTSFDQRPPGAPWRCLPAPKSRTTIFLSDRVTGGESVWS